MSAIKPPVEREQVLSLVREQLGEPVSRLEPVSGGEVAPTFAVTVGDREYIVRFAYHMGANFAKEAYLYRTIASPLIPIPPIVRIGRLGELHYAISRRVEGTPLTRLPPDEAGARTPRLVETLGAIHAVDTGATSGYGTFGDDGTGPYPSWPAFLTAIREEEPEWDFYGRWHRLFASTFLERDVFDTVYNRMLQMLDACPDERGLIHGNYGCGNVLAHNGRITAVLDWLDAKYGDSVYDVAWVPPGMDFPERVYRAYTERGIDLPRYPGRLLCYRCYIGLDALRFYAKAGREDAYRWARDRILSFLD